VRREKMECKVVRREESEMRVNEMSSQQTEVRTDIRDEVKE